MKTTVNQSYNAGSNESRLVISHSESEMKSQPHKMSSARSFCLLVCEFSLFLNHPSFSSGSSDPRIQDIKPFKNIFHFGSSGTKQQNNKKSSISLIMQAHTNRRKGSPGSLGRPLVTLSVLSGAF